MSFLQALLGGANGIFGGQAQWEPQLFSLGGQAAMGAYVGCPLCEHCKEQKKIALQRLIDLAKYEKALRRQTLLERMAKHKVGTICQMEVIREN